MQFAEQVAGVAVVFGLLGAAVWALARKSGRWPLIRPAGRKNRSMTMVERLSLTPQHILHLVKVGERTVLVATHPQGVSFEPGHEAFDSVLGSALVSQNEAES